ncbi:fatty-acyl-CoA synthase [Kocuria dechangensis]|uniref:Fatty-acyl-CoA synthase n=1 Tax=Kocuria dechangensis TaxID=1176249 RepID=A0A917GYJ3_9MICC|nr:AMP-binding protein [Kocuria dechangensis]GGG60557.1 fatty-acyl-CoA synthase [Kocuria dechangensis]
MPTTQTALTTSYWPEHGEETIRDITLGGLLREAAATVPDRLALVDGVPDPAQRRTWTYAEFLREAEKVAHALLTGFAPGTKVAIWAPNSADWVILHEGISLAGMITVPINPAYRARELQYILSQSGASVIFYADQYRGADLGEIVEEIRPELPQLQLEVRSSQWEAFLEAADPSTELPEVHPTDPIQIQYTSGTTGFPKGALLHHKGVVNEAHLVALRAGMADGDVNVNAMPMYHVGGGAVTSLGAVAMHGTYVVMNYDPGLFLELVEAYRGTHALLVPTMLLGVLDHPDRPTRDLSSFKTMMSGASAVSPALVRRTAQEMGCDFSILFGQSEMHGVISQTRITDDPEDQSKTVGQPLSHLEVKVADPITGEPVPIGVQGEVCCRGYQVMLEYYNMPEQTAQTVDAEGWLHMGDLGVMDERGYLSINGRLKDMIIRGGMNIYPREIEALIEEHPAVREAVVVGVPDPKWGEQVGAVLKLHPDAEAPAAEDLRAYCKAQLAVHKVPAIWSFVEDFPVTASGKIQKFKLREQLVTE